jgi:hypothetical protein
MTSTFDAVTTATAGVALWLDGVPEDRLFYLSLLPGLLTRVGVIENGKPVPYGEMTDRIRNEILSLTADFSSNPETGRYELVMRGAGNNIDEAKRALEWMKLALFHPDWRPENLPRIRDLVDQSLGVLRSTMQSPEERWVHGVALAYRKQDHPLLLATGSFLTQTHSALRLRWMLQDGGTEKFHGFLRTLGEVKGSRDERKALLASIRDGRYSAMESLAAREKALAVEAAKDLDLALADIPDSSLPADWKYLCNRIALDLAAGPAHALAALDEVRRSILKSGGARMFLIASSGNAAMLNAGIENLAGSFEKAPAMKPAYHEKRRVEQRLAARDPEAAHPVFVGLVNANSQGGVFLNSVPAASYRDSDTETVLDYLASNLMAGHGAHTLFMKTWGAGLAYSNGIRNNLAGGRLNYYAERTPDLPQTLQFVIDEVKKMKVDASLTDYAVAGAFATTRSADEYEARGQAMANDLADGVTPEMVTRFHKKVLELRNTKNLAPELFRRMQLRYASVLPGLGIKAKDVPGGVYLVIAPEKQIASYEEYLKKANGPEARVFRLYPRDFWLVE